MKIIDSSIAVDWIESGSRMLQRLEIYGRTAYKSEHMITLESGKEFIKMLTKKEHLSVLEHVSVSVRVICDRGVSHEIVRHRIASYTQESTRYCNYSKEKFGSEITFIRPYFLQPLPFAGCQNTSTLYEVWFGAMREAEQTYLQMIDLGAKPQEARSVLPNSLKTEIVMTMNLREWLHFFKLRTAPSAHPDMQRVAKAILNDFKVHIPFIFD